MSQTSFRTLLFLSLAVSIASIAVDFLLPSLIPEQLRVAQEAEDADLSNTALFATIGIGLAMFVVVVATYVGLYRFAAWGRSLALWFTVAALAATPFLGAWVQSGLGVALMELSSTLWGALLAVAYFGPAATH